MECFREGGCDRGCPHTSSDNGKHHDLHYCPFTDSSEGWGKARLFLEFVNKYDLSSMRTAFHSANLLAREQPEKYVAWRAMMLIQNGEKICN